VYVSTTILLHKVVNSCTDVHYLAFYYVSKHIVMPRFKKLKGGTYFNYLTVVNLYH